MNNIVREFPGKVSIISIGIPTNLGYCIHRYPDWEKYVGHVVVMGGGSMISTKSEGMEPFGQYSPNKESWGKFGCGVTVKSSPYPLPQPDAVCRFIREGNPVHLFPNHNLSGDSLASSLLFRCKFPISVVPHEITAKHWLKGVSIETLLQASTGVPLDQSEVEYPQTTQICGKLLVEWLKRRWGQRGQCPHDPLTLYEAVYPRQADNEYDEGGEFQEGRSSLRYIRGTFVCHEWAAFSTFVADPLGPHRLAISCINPEGWVSWLQQTLIADVPPSLRVEKANVKLSSFD